MKLTFEWDDLKSEACLASRGFDFSYVLRVFFDPKKIAWRDERWDYGEQRYKLLGNIDGRLFVVIYTLRSENIRIISARKANERERRLYEY